MCTGVTPRERDSCAPVPPRGLVCGRIRAPTIFSSIIPTCPALLVCCPSVRRRVSSPYAPARFLVQTGPEPTFVARSPAMREVLEHADLFAKADVTVLIEGATGTGKAYVAHYIHLMSRRCAGEFRYANAGAMDDPLAGSDLFGHARGSFTGASQHRAGCLASANGVLCS